MGWRNTYQVLDPAESTGNFRPTSRAAKLIQKEKDKVIIIFPDISRLCIPDY